MAANRETDEDIALTEAARALREEYGVSTTRWAVYRLIVDGRIAATRGGRGWMLARTDLPRVARALTSQAAPRAA